MSMCEHPIRRSDMGEASTTRREPMRVMVLVKATEDS